MVNRENNQLDTKSLRSYGIHGAFGLLMGVGAGYIILFILSMVTSLTTAYSLTIVGTFTLLIIYGLYGFYFGYIFGGQKRSRISRTFAAAGIFGGLVTAFLLAGEFIKIFGYFEPLFISMVFAGPILGFPKIKNMVIMTISSSLGAALGYGVDTSGQNLTVYLNSTLTQGVLFALFISIFFSLLAIGIAGASIAIGMYFTDGTAYIAREIPRFLKIIRGAGIVLTLILLLFSTLLFLEGEKYPTTDVSIDISSTDGNTTVLIPVILENGIVMEMYGKPAISGNAVTEIIDTDHGKAFKISGSGPIEIKMKQTGGWLARDPEANEKFNGFTLSTCNVTGFLGIHNPIDAWIYSEEDGTMFSLSIQRSDGMGRYKLITTQRKEKLIAGWQEVKFSVDDIMT